jgi:hypothetical protein
MRQVRQVRQVRHPVVSPADYDDAEFRARSVPVNWIVLVSLIRSKSTMIPVMPNCGAMRRRFGMSLPMMRTLMKARTSAGSTNNRN